MTVRLLGEKHTREPQCLDPKTRRLVVSCWKRVSEDNDGSLTQKRAMGIREVARVRYILKTNLTNFPKHWM